MNLAQQLKAYRDDFLQLIYPQYCYSCNMELVGSKSGICGVCESELQYTLFENYQEASALDKLFWGRVQLEKTFALLYYTKSGASQRILHDLKYNSRSELGLYYGQEIGQRLKTVNGLNDLSGIIPVPLHPKKQFIRGYNQAEKIADGIAEIINLPVEHQMLRRKVFAESQTKKGLLSRWENMQQVFKASNQQEKSGHYLLVDDVITTGSTLEVCVKELKQKYPGIRVSVASLAVAS
jgi:ComF family protein